MSNRRFKVWLDSGANIHSRRETEVTLDALGATPEEWDSMTEDQQLELMKEIAFECADWGFTEQPQ